MKQFRNISERRVWHWKSLFSPFTVTLFIATIVFYILLAPDAPSQLRENSGQTISGFFFSKCTRYSHQDCVVDGDTFDIGGQRIRVADIDTPETYKSKCRSEAELGAKATERFRELLNAAPFVLQSSGHRDEDKYGRKLRIVMREGQSLGSILVAEGLARKWTGRRRSWCN